jgi:uncharacterized protein YuzE
MELTFDPNTDAVLFSMVTHEGGAPTAVEFDLDIDGVQLFFFYSPEGRVVGIEVLGASRFLSPAVLSAATLD